MDLSKYIKGTEPKRKDPYSVERKCLQCNNVLTNKPDLLYYQGFCSTTCKERYVGVPL